MCSKPSYRHEEMAGNRTSPFLVCGPDVKRRSRVKKRRSRKKKRRSGRRRREKQHGEEKKQPEEEKKWREEEKKWHEENSAGKTCFLFSGNVSLNGALSFQKSM